MNVQVGGGSYSVPARRDLDKLAEQLRAVMEPAMETVRWVAGFDCPELTVVGPLIPLVGRPPGGRPAASARSARSIRA